MKKVLLAAMAAVLMLAVTSCKNVAEDTGGVTPSPTPTTISYLTFKSDKTFDLGLNSGLLNDKTQCGTGWDGTLEYSTDKTSWTEWKKGDTAAKPAVESGGSYYIYLRGKNNTSFCDMKTPLITNFILSGSNVECSGNIMTLLDYDNPGTAAMGQYCFYKLFQGCTLLTKAPDLPATALSGGCYSDLFRGCTSLTKAPDLSATTLQDYCYSGMFKGCSSLAECPALPATVVKKHCYNSMFDGCGLLTESPALPATTLAEECYHWMFKDCSSLKSVGKMGNGDDINANANMCCDQMFDACSDLVVSDTSGTPFVKFSDITGCNGMFDATGGFLGTPVVNTQYYYN